MGCAFALLFLFGQGCNKKKLFDGPNTWTDGFEAYTTLDDMLLPNDTLWSFTQITLDGNAITVDTTIVHSGQKSLKFVDQGSAGDQLSKCSIAKQNMAFWEGETMYYSIWFYLQGGTEADWLFLVDLEEQVQIAAGPGMRLAVIEDSAIVLEHKYPNPNVYQADSTRQYFPRDQWVHLEMESLLSQKKDGYVKVWQDGLLILEQYDWQTLPKDILTFMQGTKGMYSSFEIGLTANPGNKGHVLYVDDVEIGLR